MEELEEKLLKLKQKFVANEISIEKYKEDEKKILDKIDELEAFKEKSKPTKDDTGNDEAEEYDEEKPPTGKFNIWYAVVPVLVILLVASIFTGGFGMAKASTNTGNVISAQAASAKTVDYINKMLQGQGTAKVLSIQDAGSLYAIKLDVGGQTYNSYVTKDGELLFPSFIDMTKPLPASSTNQTAPTDTSKVSVSADDDPAIGPIDAKVTIIEFSDFQCPFCGRAEPTVKQILQTYGDKVRFVYRDFPLSFHENAEKAAEAAECAYEQDKERNDINETFFWKYHDKLYENQNSLDVNSLKQYAKDLGLNTTQFNACLDSGKYQSEVAKDEADGQKAGVSGTPAFFINGQLISGAQPFSVFQQAIDAELAK